MSEPFLSASWHLVSQLKPRLPPHWEVTRQRVRGRAEYIIRNPITGQSYRCSASAYQLLGTLDGDRTLSEAWKEAAAQLDDAAPTQDETIRLLAQLHDADLLQTDINPGAAELAQRRSKARRRLWLQSFGNPLALRIRIWDPDAFITRTEPLLRPFFRRFVLVLWGSLVLSALFLAVQHWGELTNGVTDRLLATENLFAVALIFPVVKAIHELAHAYAVKAGGGEVHEIGIMLLVLLPIPYVDASASSAFRSKWERAGVGAAGMMAETFLASIAMHVWLWVEPGVVRSIAFNTMAIAGISTVFFNGNPLLRFDGYFIFCDLVEAPNLAARAAGFWGWIVERYGFGRKVSPPVTTTGERWLFAFYAPTSLVYRILVTAGVALLIAQRFLVVGVLIALWGIATSILVPLVRWIWWLAASPSLASADCGR